jgi:hypothetical protein
MQFCSAVERGLKAKSPDKKWYSKGQKEGSISMHYKDGIERLAHIHTSSRPLRLSVEKIPPIRDEQRHPMAFRGKPLPGYCTHSLFKLYRASSGYCTLLESRSDIGYRTHVPFSPEFSRFTTTAHLIFWDIKHSSGM